MRRPMRSSVRPLRLPHWPSGLPDMDVVCLAEQWEEDAAKLREYGQEASAKVAELHAHQLREALQRADAELLAPSEAAAFSNFSKRRLRELVLEGKLENCGKPGAPRYRRSDLPTKARVDDGFDPAAEARRLVAS